ncbi:MAG TPA: holo-ACP synthase, partial [Gammaproteobacteria bacterium]
MIVGIGSDLVRLSRFEALLQRRGDAFARRILAAAEYREFLAAPHPARFLAKRFAAKEAAAKALGTGIRDGLRLAHLAVEHDPLGQPRLQLLERAAELGAARGVTASHLSLADEGDYALAFVVL